MDKLFYFFSTIRWQDIADIALSSYILFRLYALFKGTNVFRIVIGIAALWFFQRISSSLGLIVTSWAIQGITALAALIIIVVFRNEIRSVLQVKNLRAILWGFPRKVADTPAEIIVDSAFEMARRRMGGLMVFPGKEDLGELIHSGIPWQGRISQEMILSIFWPDNPVHDGAAVIEGDLITEVGVLLPLSHRKDLPSHYGTRHRAAAGLAENTDALAIAVSEEVGNVTVAQGSRVRVIRSKEQLSQILQEHCGVPSSSGKLIKTQHVQLGIAALVSILFVSGILISFTRGLDTLVTFEVPVEYMNRNPQMEIVETSVNTVRLNLIGSGALIKTTRPDQVQMKLDLSKATLGKNTFTITQDSISLPPGIQLKNIIPETIDVTLDIPIKKELPIQIDWAGKLPGDLLIKEANLESKTVEVIGGKQVLENISTIYTERVAVDKLKQSGALTLNLVLNPPSLKIAPGSKERVTVHYVIGRREIDQPQGRS